MAINAEGLPSITCVKKSKCSHLIMASRIYKYMFGRSKQNHHIMIGAHIEEGIYGPLYFGYGGPGQKGEREKSMRSFEEQILEIAPDTILILVKADPEVIKTRMEADPHSNGCLKEKDIEHVLKRFDEEYEASLLNNKFTIDTSSSKIGESFEELIQLLQPYI